MNSYLNLTNQLEQQKKQFNKLIHEADQMEHSISNLRKQLIFTEPVLKMIWIVESANEIAKVFKSFLDDNKILTPKGKKNVHLFVKYICHFFSFQKQMADGSWQELSEITIRNAMQDRE